MIEALNGLPLVELTAPSLLALTVLMVLTGRLSPRSVVEDKQAEAQQWRDAYEKEREARSLSDSQTAELLEVSKTNHALITAIFANSERIRPGETDDATVPKA